MSITCLNDQTSCQAKWYNNYNHTLYDFIRYKKKRTQIISGLELIALNDTQTKRAYIRRIRCIYSLLKTFKSTHFNLSIKILPIDTKARSNKWRKI